LCLNKENPAKDSVIANVIQQSVPCICVYDVCCVAGAVVAVDNTMDDGPLSDTLGDMSSGK